MTVKDLIQKLQQVDQDLPVAIQSESVFPDMLDLRMEGIKPIDAYLRETHSKLFIGYDFRNISGEYEKVKVLLLNN